MSIDDPISLNISDLLVTLLVLNLLISTVVKLIQPENIAYKLVTLLVSKLLKSIQLNSSL